MAIKAGWYKFNGVLTAPSQDLSVNIPFKIHVELSAYVGMDEYTCSEMKVMADGEVRYVLTEGNIGSAESGVEFPYELTAYKDGWRTEYGYVDTIEVQADTEVSDEFVEWFAISTNPTDEPDEPDTPDIPDVPDTTKVIKAGTYRFNDVLSVPSASIKQSIEFTDALNTQFENFDLRLVAGFSLLYGLAGEAIYAYSEYEGSVATWAGEWYQTITIPEDTVVSDEFVAWFKDNTQRLSTIAYNGSTIASILGGQKATLKCAGMTMESDVVVDVAEVDIPEGDIPEGYVKPEGALYISRNGTHDVTNFAEAVVNVKAEAETPDQNSVVPLTITENGVYEAPGKPDYKIEWDGNTEGLERVGQMYFVSDFEINDVEELNGIHGVYINGNSTEESELTFSPFSITGYEGYQGEGYFSSGLTSPFCWYVPGKGFAFNKSGDRYYTKSITIPAGGDPIVGYSPITVNVKGCGGGESEAEKFFAENFPSDVWAEGEYTNSSLGVPITMRYLYRRDRQDPKEIAFVADVNGGYDGLQTANLADYYVFASIDVSYTVPVYDNTILLRNPVAPIFFDLSAAYSAWLGMEVSVILNATLCAMKDGTYDGSGSTYLSTQANFSAVVDGDFGDVKLTTILANNPTSMTWTYETGHALGGNITGVRHIKSGWTNITENDNYSWNLVEDGFDGVSAITVNVPTGGGDAEKYFEGGYAEVVLPNVTSIKAYAFYYDAALVNIEMPKVTSIGNYAFQNCTNLALTSLPSGVTKIGSAAFQKCTNLALTSLPSGVTKIDTYSFSNCTNLALTSLPSGVTSIGNYAFNGCTNLALTSLPSGVTSIGNYAFNGCTNLALTSLPSGVTKIGDSVFKNCTNLALTSLPSGVKSIEGGAFIECTALTTLTFEGKPTSIANTAFKNCTNLTTINVPWAEGAVANAPWGATNATINYNYTGE